SGPIYLETRLTEHLVGFFQKLGVDHLRQDVAPDRSNVVARVRGTGSGPTIWLDAHQDTVPVDGMTIDPFKPIVDGDRLYGRGSSDVKGGMASRLSAFARLAADKQPPPGDVIMSCTCD